MKGIIEEMNQQKRVQYVSERQKVDRILTDKEGKRKWQEELTVWEDASVPCRTPEKFETWKCQVRERVKMKCEELIESPCTE